MQVSLSFFLSLILKQVSKPSRLKPQFQNPSLKRKSMGTLTYGLKHRHKNAHNWISVKCFAFFSFYILTSLDINKTCFASVGLKSANKPLLLLKQLVGGTKPLPHGQPLHRTVLWAAHGPGSETHSSSLRNSPSKGLPCIISTALYGKHEQHPNSPSLLQKAALLN